MKAKAYVKVGCPFSFKFLTFMAEAMLLDEIEIVRMQEGAADYEPTKKKLAEALGKAPSFPTVEIEPNQYMTDSDRLIEHYATRDGLRPDDMPDTTCKANTASGRGSARTPSRIISLAPQRLPVNAA